MKKEDFFAQYRSQWWIETSKRIKARDHNTCQMCGRNDKPLSVHHLHYGENGSLEVGDESLITLCEDCHKLQNTYRGLIDCLIQTLKEKLTDVELYAILCNAIEDYTLASDEPIYLLKLNPQKQLHVCNEEFDYYFGNIYDWRVRIYRNAIKRQVLWEYFVHKELEKDTKTHEDFFQDNFGIDIKSYISENGVECANLQQEVIAHLKKIERYKYKENE